MSSLRPITSAVLGACLMQACGAPPAQQEMVVQPVTQVRHAANQSAASYYQVGRYHQQRGDLDLALMAYTNAIARDGGQLESRSAAAAIHAQQGRLDLAKAMLLAVVADYPTAAFAYNNLGYVYYLQGDHVAAAGTLRKALALEAGNDRTRNNLRLTEDALARQNGKAVAGTAPVEPSVAVAVPPAGAPMPLAASTMELVELSPNVFELKRRAAPLAEFVPLLTPRPAQPDMSTRVEIANGNGVAGMARRIKAVLGRQGIAVSRLTNARPFHQLATTIEYRIGHARRADQLRDALGGHALLVAAPNLPAQSDVRLVLGRDATVHFAWLIPVDSVPLPAEFALLVPQIEFPI